MEENKSEVEEPKRLTKEQWVAQMESNKLVNKLVRKGKHKAMIESGNMSLLDRI